MNKKPRVLPLALITLIVILLPLLIFFPRKPTGLIGHWSQKHRTHLDHSPFFSQAFESAEQVTKACLQCHPKTAHEVMKTAHFTWISGEAKVGKGVDQKIIPVGKKNLFNNFCLGITSNWPSCTKCHAGYGWKDARFDFNKEESVDCLVCHDQSGSYVKGQSGWPEKTVDLLQVAKSVGTPRRENCGVCHFNGGGGMAVKHGDLDSSLLNPTADVDVHMGGKQMLCIDCHKTKEHLIAGKARSTGFSESNLGIECTQCHGENLHADERLNVHTASVACQTCHIPRYAKRVDTKMAWDWSKAGDSTREDDIHHYLKIKGEFKYEKKVRPEYAWFNRTFRRYLQGDPIDESGVTVINPLNGSIQDPNSKIYPFKVHRGVQPYDKKYKYLLLPKTAGEGGYWNEFNWKKAFELASRDTGLKFSGEYGFTRSIMYWPISHMVSPKQDALQCGDCHSASGVLDWKALGYARDPINGGSRRSRQTESRP